MNKRLVYLCLKCGVSGTPIRDDNICGNCNSAHIQKLTDYNEEPQIVAPDTLPPNPKSTTECPECSSEILEIPTREPLPPSSSTGWPMTTTTAFTVGAPEYPPTSNAYKCANPKCWVTKIGISWS